MPLTEAKIKGAKPQPEKAVRLYDRDGLYLEVAPSGGKWWRLKYRFAGRENRLSLGVYPSVDLKTARSRCDDVRKQVNNRIDPSQQRKAEKAALRVQSANTFEAIAREWHSQRVPTLNAAHAARVLRLLERDVFSSIGTRPIAEIEAPELLHVLRRIEARGVRMTTHRARIYSEMVFRYAIASGRCKRNPAVDLKGALAPMPKGNFPAITDPKEFGNLLRTLNGYEGTFVVETALRLAPILVVRPGELRHAKWAEFDLRAGEWRFTTSKTKMLHLVPLSRQAVKFLSELHKLTGDGEFVFPSARSSERPMSDNAILAAMRRMEIPVDVMTGHGFRATFRTIGAEVLKFRVDLLEHQLGHAVKDANGSAYNRTSFLPERRKMMQRWSDYCDALRNGGEVVAMPKRA